MLPFMRTVRHQINFGKSHLLLPVIPMTATGLVLGVGAEIDLGLVAANVFGVVLLLGTFAAVGVFASSLTRQPINAALIGPAILVGS